jgi:hypothetical protein
MRCSILRRRWSRLPNARRSYFPASRGVFWRLLALAASLSTAAGSELRIGIIGCDTSHVPAFTEMLNNPNAKGHVPGGRVVAAFKGGSSDVPSSWSRVDQYATTLQANYGVKFYPTIEALCQNVDAVLLESVDGRPHLAQARPVIAAHKPLFIDKPMAGSLDDVLELFELAKKSKVPVFSSSALRFGLDTQAVAHGSLGRVRDAETYGPCEIEPHHPDLFWYGVHGVESLYAVMGQGCLTVQRGSTADGKIEVVGTWKKGRKGIYREAKDYRGLACGENGRARIGSLDGYEPLVAEIMKFFQTGVAPVNPKETIEMFAFMEAADASKAKAGGPVKIKDVLKAARRH